MGRDSTSGALRTEIHDSVTGERLNSVYYKPEFEPILLSTAPDLNGNGVDELVLMVWREAQNRFDVVVKDGLSDTWLGTFPFHPDFRPQAMLVVPDTNGNGVPEPAVLTLAPTAAQADKLEIRDLDFVSAIA